ncbi:MAG: LysE family transporter, partial [Lentisphaerae bacterium]|nr:LysE family transporter [Lentisphaerota bacterium]
PYFTGWWATVGTGQMATFGLRRRCDYAAFWVGHELGDVVWYVAVAALLALGRGLLSDAAYQALLMVCGAAIVLVAVAFLVLGVRCLRPAGSVPNPAVAAGAPTPSAE